MHTANPSQTRLALNLALNETIPGKIALALAASVFVALCAHASIHLGFTPVPITLSDLAVLLVGLVLGPSTAFAALMMYLAEGAMGLPVFNPGPGGLAQLLGPTGGYLFAYPFAAALAGQVRDRLPLVKSQFARALTGSAIASAFILLSGVLWLTLYMHHSLATSFWLGAAVFIPVQVVKVFVAAGIFTSLKQLRRA